jgi:uncharacterized Zn finger protein (UPF0148 family)
MSEYLPKSPMCPLGKTPLVRGHDGYWECPGCGWRCAESEREEQTQ